MNKKFENITFIIKSYERKSCVEDLVNSISLYIVDPIIIIVDDSHEPLEFNLKVDVSVFYVGHNLGLSYGRNFAVSKVKTEYFILLDDDFLFTNKTDISFLLETLLKYGADIVGGVCIDFGFKKRIYNGTYIIEDKLLTLDVSNTREKIKKVDFCLNFFIARTNAVKSFLWDDEIKIHREHDDFFLRAKNLGINVYHNDYVEIEHHPNTNPIYYKDRASNLDYIEKYFNEKFDLEDRIVIGKTSKIINFSKAILSKSFYLYVYNRFIKNT